MNEELSSGIDLDLDYLPYGTFNIEAMDAHGGWLSSSEDLTKILIASSGKGTDRDILSAESVKDMLQPGAVNKNYGLAWCTNEAGNRWHTGSLIGASSMMVGFDNQSGAVILFNSIPLTGDYFKNLD